MYTVLAFCGALPFVAGALLTLTGNSSAPLVGPVTEAVATYGLVIASFMAGVHWGTYLYHASHAPTNLFLTSNAIAIFVWLSYVLGGARITLAALVAAFSFLLALDSALYRSALIDRDYFMTRCIVTAIVIASLVCTLVLS